MKRKIKLHIKRGDLVKVIAGNNKNKVGQVATVYPLKYRAIVEGLNLVTHFKKASKKNPKGSIEKKEAPLHISNLMLIDPETKLPTRVGRKLNSANKLMRYAKKTGKFI
jgi:large subunit ribosomal protein L24